FFEIGGYLQFARLPAGDARYAGAKLRFKLVTPPGWDSHLRLGLNLELSWLPEQFEPSRFGGEVRPIAAWEDDLILAAFNPSLGLAFARPGGPDGPSLEPAAMAKLKILGGKLAVGVEYYSQLGTFSGIAPLREQQHYFF